MKKNHNQTLKYLNKYIEKIQSEIQSEIHSKKKFQWLRSMTQDFMCKVSLYTILMEIIFILLTTHN